MEPSVKDILWKGIIEDLFADFLRFFYAKSDEIFDLNRGFEFLDKELDQLYTFEKELDVITVKNSNMGIRELAIKLITEDTQAKVVRNLLTKTSHSIQEIADLVGVSVDFVIEEKNHFVSKE